MEKDGKMKIVFAPGCFDNFEGSQEELDELIAELTRMAEDGTLMEQGEPLEVDDETDRFLMDALREYLEGGETDGGAGLFDAIDTGAKERKRRLN